LEEVSSLWSVAAHYPIPKNPCLFVQPNLLDLDRAFLEFARTPANLGGDYIFGDSTGTLFDSKKMGSRDPSKIQIHPSKI